MMKLLFIKLYKSSCKLIYQITGPGSSVGGDAARDASDSSMKYDCAEILFLFLFLLWFNVPVNNFSVMLRRSHLFLGITSTFGE